MTNTTNKILNWLIYIGLALISFIPLYVANSMFFPFITGKAFVFRIMVEIVFALWLVLVLREKGTSTIGTSDSVAPRVNSLTICVTVFALIALIADLLGLNILRSFWSNFERMEGWMTIVHLWAYFIVLSSAVNTREKWNKFFNIVLVAGAITALYGLVQFFGWAVTHQGSSRIDASLGNSAYMAVYMLINAFIAVYMALVAYSSKSKPLFWIYTVLAIFFSFIMFQTATRGTIVGWVVAIVMSLAIYAIFGRKEKGQSGKSRAIAGGIIALSIVMVVLFFANKDASWIKNNGVLGRLATISLGDTKTQARGFIWPMAVKGVFESPRTAVIGVGQENFNYIFNKNYDPKMWAHEQWFDRAHSVFLDWLVAGGLLGLISYLALYVFALIYIIKSDLTIGQKSAVTGLIVGYAIHNVFVFDNQTSYVMFFTVLAFIHSFKTGKIYSFISNSETQSEDAKTVRDYIFIPLIVLGFVASLYFINVRPIQANTRLINALRVCGGADKGLALTSFISALSLDQTVANQEIREHYYNCAGNVVRSNIPENQKLEFYNLAKSETEKQIASTPSDARIYIIGGSFFNSIGDIETARPLLERAYELSPTKQSIMYELANNYTNSGKTKEALGIMEKAYMLAQDNAIMKTGYIATLISAGEEKKAIEIFGSDQSMFTDLRVINAYISLKQYTKAIELYKKLLIISPDDSTVYSGLATAYLLNKQDAKAVEILKQAREKFIDLKAQIDAVIKQIQDGTLKL